MDRKPDIVCVSSIDWDFIWQGHQEIMATFAAQGHRVLFLENTGVRAPQMRDLPRVRQRFRNWWRGTKGFRQERPNLFVFSPLVVPLPYSRVARWVNRWLLARALKRWMRATGLYRPIVWTFLPTPLAVDLIREFDPQLTIYYCIDDFVSSSPGARRIVASEQRLFRDADLVFVTSERLRARAAVFNPRVHLFPFGVNFDRFDAIRAESPPLPEELQGLPHPVVGYVGGLHQWIDQELVAAVARQLPGATFAMIGPKQTDTSVLEREPNIRLLGQRPHPELARYIRGFDVGIVPYKLSEYTANVYPTKLNEYLVMGVPVVATDLPEIRRFNKDHGEIVRVATAAEAFADASVEAARGSSPDEIARRVEVAHSNSWPSRIASMQTLIDEGIARRAATEQRSDTALPRAYRRTRGRAGRAVLAAIAAYLLVFQTNLVWWCAEPLKLDAPPGTADAIVVFAGGVGESGRAGGGAQERLKQAIDLYRAGYASYLVFSSGFVYSFHEAQVMRALALDQGVPASVIALDERATNTYENVRYVDEILRDHHWRRILLVSSPYHMRRAMMVWRKQAPDVEVIPAPVPQSQFYDHGRGATLDQARGILQEYLAIFGYWRRGWL